MGNGYWIISIDDINADPKRKNLQKEGMSERESGSRRGRYRIKRRKGKLGRTNCGLLFGFLSLEKGNF